MISHIFRFHLLQLVLQIKTDYGIHAQYGNLHKCSYCGDPDHVILTSSTIGVLSWHEWDATIYRQ
jgi:hypothetical protein